MKDGKKEEEMNTNDQNFEDAEENPPAHGTTPEPTNQDNPHAGARQARQAKTNAQAPKSRLHSPAQNRRHRAKSILKPDTSKARVSKRQTRASTFKPTPKAVTVAFESEIRVIESPSHSNDENETPSPPSLNVSGNVKTDEQEAEESDDDMVNNPPAAPARPQLKLKLSKAVVPQDGGIQPLQTPLATSAIRTPSIKLKIGTPQLSTAPNVPKPKKADTITSTPGSSTKKRKKPIKADDSEDELDGPTKPPVIRKLTLTTQPGQRASTAKAPTQPVPISVKLKQKGKIPKRQIGVGYDSELDEREPDPMVHEGFVLRMQPGPDCDYLRKAIEEGTVFNRSKGGADVRMRMLDTMGRRGILIIKGNQYATSLVDLPCVIEGMKSWDKKGWIKSIDISQILLVLGRCNTDEEARNYPLPPDVDPKNYQYAHGLTAPMKWVRKRRFARTKRTRVDDIESVERRVKALLEADKAASQVRYQLLDHDPRLDEERYSSGLDDEDAEGEEDDDVDGYFSMQNGNYAPAVETPMFTETPVEDIGQDEVDEFERMFVGDDEGPSAETASQAHNTLHIPNAGDSSFAVTSTSASPSATAAHTPASAAEQSSDEDDDDEGGEDDEDLDDAEKQGDENLQQVKDRIEDMQQKIAEQTELLKKTQNAILKKKLARKIQDLKDDVSMMKKNAGLGGDEDDD
ncbi:transcription initiation factor TFIID subunit D6 [Exophiala viscosa]|uniref:Transcription initiation factor TFIID subunit D6 n=1 Tax=Exophiala viscosa TaxID=2486360 RepID=A0AAN6IDW3_9EURO|nr:transcription initiation factor TFIID subunit D6 [Exophiala viscosa]